jgi:parallel beta-helix repeat protein
MKRKVVSGIMLTLLLSGMFSLTSNLQQVNTEPTTIIVPDDYPTIQEAINHANEGDKIFVRNGTYYENVIVNKTVSLIGENKTNTIIDGNRTGDVIYVTADNVLVNGFTIQNSGYGDKGIHVSNCDGVIVTDNIVSHNHYGIWLHTSNYVDVTGNVITSNNGTGIFWWKSNGTLILRNTVSENAYDGIFMRYVTYSVVEENIIHLNEQEGIWLSDSRENVITKNMISNNENSGIYPWCSNNNKIYHNNFINNTEQVLSYDSSNTWDNGCEGNYWSNYNGTDLDGDGIGDTYLPWEGVDYYPLMNRYWNPADINHDLVVDLGDVVKAALAFCSYPGHERWNPHADLNYDNIIDIDDIIVIAINFGKTYT